LDIVNRFLTSGGFAGAGLFCAISAWLSEGPNASDRSAQAERLEALAVFFRE
jgi:hypothetical protein